MVFSSIIFAGAFLPAVFLLNLPLPIGASNLLLLAASLLLYAWGEPVYVLMLLGCIALNYALGRLIARGRHKRALLAAAVAANLGAMGAFKYAGFVAESLNALPGVALPVPEIAMPIGISFFTFQAMSYVIDVYRGECPAQRSLVRFALYVSFFPQLIAGPIVKYHELEGYLERRRVTPEGASAGLRRFAVGLGKKVLVANALSVPVDALYARGGGALNAPLAWLAAVGYALQIYFDFSGYSDMAIGMGGMFGFRIPENFDHPYMAASLREFWRRWHISLSGWFRDYLYIPLGGNRRGAARTHLNRLLVFLLTGLWHGASWSFVLWGLGHGALATLENTGLLPVNRLKGRARWLGAFYTFAAVTCLFVLFRADTLPQAGAMLRAMFAGGLRFDTAQRVCLADALTPHVALTLLAAALAAGPAPAALARHPLPDSPAAEAAQMLLALALLVASMAALVAQTANPFIYFRF